MPSPAGGRQAQKPVPGGAAPAPSSQAGLRSIGDLDAGSRSAARQERTPIGQAAGNRLPITPMQVGWDCVQSNDRRMEPAILESRAGRGTWHQDVRVCLEIDNAESQ